MIKNPCSWLITGNPADVILLIFALIVLLVLLWCIWAFFYAIFLFIFSKWDDAKVKSAWNSIRYMIIWLFLTVMLIFLAPTVLKMFNIDKKWQYSFGDVFNKATWVVTCVATGVWEVVKIAPNGWFWSSWFVESSESLEGDYYL